MLDPEAIVWIHVGFMQVPQCGRYPVGINGHDLPRFKAFVKPSPGDVLLSVPTCAH